jgi:SAM-dependent methyltransferase/septal ring factor EnvC (AmiA/AmiB activator)
MKRDPDSGIRILDRTVEYRDGSEDRLYSILAEASDRSSLSDELAAKIDDWPTRYHLSRQRANLVRPLRLEPSLRILEIGAGTGAISRYLGESGANVTALEGSLERARAAALRCEDLGNVEVVCGALEAFEDSEGFDLVCLVGVLEYAGCGKGETAGPKSFLDHAARHLRPDGALLVAIENQIGLKYLVGYEEDHLGRPWAGVEGYGQGEGVETFSRRRLGDLLDACGLTNQNWFFPFPDYKLPAVVLSEAAYAEEDAPTLVDQLVRSPVNGATSARALLCDDRRAHQVLLEAGLGPDVANSFMVVAMANDVEGHPSLPDPSAVAWYFGDERQTMWIRHQVVEQTPEGRRVRLIFPDHRETVSRRGWLRQQLEMDEPFRAGPTLEKLAVEACRRGDIEKLAEVLDRWRGAIDGHRYPRPKDLGASNPFSDNTTGDVLPPSFLDLCLSNFVATDDHIEFIDREWEAGDAVDAEMVMMRGLWLLARTLVLAGSNHPWSPTLTVDELTIKLSALCGGLRVDAELLDAWRTAEVELQALVSGSDPDDVRADLDWLGSLSPTSREALDALPYTAVTRRIDQLQSELEHLANERAERARLDRELSDERKLVAKLSKELPAAHKQIEKLGTKLEETAHALHEVQGYNKSLVDTQRDIEAEGSRLDRELSDERKLVAKLSRELPAAHKQIEELGTKLEETASALHEIQEYNKSLADPLQDIEAERTRLEDELSRERKLVAKLSKELPAAHKQIEELGTKLEKSAHALNESQEHGETLTNRVEEAEQVSDQLRVDLAATHQTLQSERTRLEDELSRERKLVAQLSKELPAAQSQIEKLGTKLEKTAHALSKSQEYGETLANRVDKAEQVSDILRKDLTDAEGRIEQMQAWRESFERRLLVRAWRRVQGLMGFPSDEPH